MRGTSPLLFAGLFVAVAWVSTDASAATLEVAPEGADFSSIQAAINAASSGDTVLVHPGTYIENISFTGDAVTLVSAQGPEVTIIDGGGTGVVVNFDGDSLVLDGFTITNGGGRGIRSINRTGTISNCIVEGNAGGGVYVEGGSFTLAGSTIRNNSATDVFGDGGGVAGGGGVRVFRANIDITGCEITGNSSGFAGGGLYVDGVAHSITVSDCRITGNNSGAVGGGGVYAAGWEIDISNCEITGNASTGDGGGVYAGTPIGSITVSDCDISRNSSGEHGGGIFAGVGVTVTDCMIDRNEASSGGGIVLGSMMKGGSITRNVAYKNGGGVLAGAGTLANVVIAGNTAYTGGGGVSCSDTVIRNAVISGNMTLAKGGGILVSTGHPVITNVTVAGNRSRSGGAGIHVWPFFTAGPTIKNSIVWGNLQGGKVLRNKDFVTESNSTPGISFSNLGRRMPGVGNFSANPRFVSARSAKAAPTVKGDYHLRPRSPCIDAGTPTGAPDDDFEGAPRPVGKGVDVGADEYGSVPGANVLVNGGFETGVDPWQGKNLTRFDGVTLKSASEGASSFLMTANGRKKTLSQVVALSGSAGDAFVLSGWNRAAKVLRGQGLSEIAARIHHTDGSSQRFVIRFRQGPHPWEFARTDLQAKKDYDAITVTVSSRLDGGKVWFDDIRLNQP